jgi:hypothetical protein
VQFDPELVELFCSLFREVVPRPDPTLLVSPPLPIGDLMPQGGHTDDHDHGHDHGSGRAASA